MKFEIIDNGKLLVTLKFTKGTQEIARNFAAGDKDMALDVIKSTQRIFLAQEHKDPNKLKLLLVEKSPELETEAKSLVEDIWEAVA